MSNVSICYCGHLDEEHRDGHRECEICGCICFEENPDASEKTTPWTGA
ncbi:MAG: hypothetical protein ACLGPL_11580 [Acidobacteriota bacterium]